MNSLQWLKRKLGVTSKADRRDDWPCVVLLLEKPFFPSPKEAVQTGQASWGAHAPVELMSVANGGNSYILTSGTFVFSVNVGSGQYGPEGQEPSEAQQRPWDEHRAWLSIDAPTANVEKLRQSKSLGGVYQLLLVYALKSWSPNCLGIYFPCEGVTLPNLGELSLSLQWGRQNGINLSFLK
ncbi:MAG: hypothetical protein ABSG51_02770 [Terracidiphilus sp.]|jgi:hypothetical protein